MTFITFIFLIRLVFGLRFLMNLCFTGLVPNLTAPNYGFLYFSWKWNYGWVIMLIAVVLDLDPLCLILRNNNIITSLCFLLVRVVLLQIVTNELFKALNTYLTYGLVLVCCVNDFIRRISHKKTPLNNLDSQVVQFYGELQLWNGYVNQNFCYFSVPPSIFFGVSFIIITFYGTIRMAGKMSWFCTPSSPISWGMALLFIVTLLPFAAMVFENSSVYLKKLSRNAFSKHDRKLFRTLRPLSIGIGPFGRVDNGLKQEVINYLMEYTSNLLITF